MIPLSQLTSLKGRTAVVTGAGNGIGRAIALRLAEAGAGLILVDRHRADLQKTAQTAARLFDGTVHLHDFDIGDYQAILSFWKRIDAASVDILVNNAGIYPFKPFLELTPSFLERVHSVNCTGALWMSQQLIRARQGQGGTIVNIGSVEAILPFKRDLAHYGVSKAGLLALTRDLAREFGADGFRVNAVLTGGIISKGTTAAAGTIITGLQLSLIRDGLRFIQRLALRRLGRPDEIARMVLVLCSGLASYCQGALITVDGGFLSS